MQTIVKPLIGAAVLLAAAGCGRMTIPASQGAMGRGDRALPTGQPVAVNRTDRGDDYSDPDDERVARTTGRLCHPRVPEGYVIVDRMPDDPSRPCPNGIGRIQKYPVRIVTKVDRLPYGTVLVICSESPIPPGWAQDRLTEKVEETRCQSDTPDTPISRRVRQIIRH